MKLPALQQGSASMQGVTAFKGYNHQAKIGDYEFYDMQNITSENLPVIASRGARGRVRELTKCNGLYAHEKLCWVDGTDFYYDGAIKGSVTDSEKQFVRMGAYVLIWPDAVRYNTKTDEFESLNARYESAQGATVSAMLSKADGTGYGEYTVSNTEPASPADGDYWLDTGGDTDVLKQYSATTSMWTSLATTYVRIEAPGIGAEFEQYDGVNISGMDDDELNGSFFLVEKDTDWIVVKALISAAIAQNTAPVEVSRTAPQMDYLCECNNRVWGCSSDNNEIYACTLGDPKNWNQFMGLSTDSYAVNVGSTGPFTGAIAHVGDVLFFKEAVIHRVMGTMPSNYTTYDTGARGVAQGSAKSLCVVNETLYYRGTKDVCAFAQSLPVSISANMGTAAYKNATGGMYGKYYYLCMENESGGHDLFAYNTEAGVWTREDGTNAAWFAQCDGELYFISGNTIYSVGGTQPTCADEQAAAESGISWMLETGDLGIDEAYNKRLSGIQLYAQTAPGKTLRVEIQYDAAGAWNEVFRATPETQRAMTIPITTRRCRTLRLRISGEGAFRLWSIVRRVTAGSDAYAT